MENAEQRERIHVLIGAGQIAQARELALALGIEDWTAGLELREANLRGADLSSLDLSLATLKDCDLTGASLRGANLTGANLHASTLTRCDLRGATLTAASLRDASFRVANLSGVDLRTALHVPEDILCWVGAKLGGASVSTALADALNPFLRPRSKGYTARAYVSPICGVFAVFPEGAQVTTNVARMRSIIAEQRRARRVDRRIQRGTKKRQRGLKRRRGEPIKKPGAVVVSPLPVGDIIARLEGE